MSQMTWQRKAAARWALSFKPLTQISLVTSIPRLWASLTKTLNSFMASRPELPQDEYLAIGAKKFIVEYPQKFILAQWSAVIWNQVATRLCFQWESHAKCRRRVRNNWSPHQPIKKYMVVVGGWGGGGIAYKFEPQMPYKTNACWFCKHKICWKSNTDDAIYILDPSPHTWKRSWSTPVHWIHDRALTLYNWLRVPADKFSKVKLRAKSKTDTKRAKQSKMAKARIKIFTEQKYSCNIDAKSIQQYIQQM